MMALNCVCEKGHQYIQPDIIIGDLKGQPVCPQCRAELEPECIPIEDLKRVHLKPGDVLVVRLQRPAPINEKLRLKKELSETFPDNKVLIVEHGLELCVIAND
jgi:hypothetical protein